MRATIFATALTVFFTIGLVISSGNRLPGFEQPTFTLDQFEAGNCNPRYQQC